MANHRSMLDIPLYALSCKNTFRFLAKAELTKVPLLGYVIKKLYITVNRGDRRDRSRSLEAMTASIKENISVFLCPEGTRNTTGTPLLEMKDGAFLTAIKTQLPIAVLTVMNTEKLLSPKRPFELRPGKMIAHWSEPIETKGMNESDIGVLKERIRKMMMEILIAKN